MNIERAYTLIKLGMVYQKEKRREENCLRKNRESKAFCERIGSDYGVGLYAWYISQNLYQLQLLEERYLKAKAANLAATEGAKQ